MSLQDAGATSVNPLVKEFLNEYWCLGFFRLSPCQDPAIKLCRWPRQLSVALAELAIPYKCQVTQQNQCWTPPQRHLVSNELPFRGRSLFISLRCRVKLPPDYMSKASSRE